LLPLFLRRGGTIKKDDFDASRPTLFSIPIKRLYSGLCGEANGASQGAPLKSTRQFSLLIWQIYDKYDKYNERITILCPNIHSFPIKQVPRRFASGFSVTFFHLTADCTMKSAIITIVIGFTIVQALNHIVTLGQGGNLAFAPDEITANVGDTVQFNFYPKVSLR